MASRSKAGGKSRATTQGTTARSRKGAVAAAPKREHGRGKGAAQSAAPPTESAREKTTRPVGPVVDPLPPGRRPDGRILFGRTVTLERVDPALHARDLFDASHDGRDPEGTLWTYMAFGPWSGFAAFEAWLQAFAADRELCTYSIVPRASRKPAGMASYMNMRPAAGVMEIGNIWLAPRLQRTREATESIFLLMRHAFEDLGCRRLEWKCDALNAPSRAAAERFGFTFEGIFRKHMIVKGRSRDTAWFSIIDEEWPRLRAGFLAWLADDNFDAEGRQKRALTACFPENELRTESAKHA